MRSACVECLQPGVQEKPCAWAEAPSSCGQVALLFLLRGDLPHERTWAAWLAGAEGLIPSAAVAAACCDGGSSSTPGSQDAAARAVAQSAANATLTHSGGDAAASGSAATDRPAPSSATGLPAPQRRRRWRLPRAAPAAASAAAGGVRPPVGNAVVLQAQVQTQKRHHTSRAQSPGPRARRAVLGVCCKNGASGAAWLLQQDAWPRPAAHSTRTGRCLIRWSLLRHAPSDP